MFIFQQSQITQQDFKQLAELMLKNSMVYAPSNFDVGKVNSPLHLPLKPDAVFEKGESFKNVLDARYVNSLIDASKCNWPLESILNQASQK